MLNIKNLGKIPKGDRGEFVKLNITIHPDLLFELKKLAANRSFNKHKNKDQSAIVREAIIDLLIKEGHE